MSRASIHDTCTCGRRKQVFSIRCKECAKDHRRDPILRRERCIARFWERVDKTDDCWLWSGAQDHNGYGRYTTAGVLGSGLAHRIAYLLTHGAIPDGLELDHLCRTPLCVNPAHLEPVTHRENLIRGEGFSGRAARATHCPKGHPYGPHNTYYGKNGGRSCRACHRDRMYRSYVPVVKAK